MSVMIIIMKKETENLVSEFHWNTEKQLLCKVIVIICFSSMFGVAQKEKSDGQPERISQDLL